jgi:pilus assembly protein TadC
MSVTIWFLMLLALPVILYLYEDKQQQEYLAELEILDEAYVRLLDAGVLSAPTSTYYEYRP